MKPPDDPLAQRRVNGAVAGDAALTFERVGSYDDPPVAFPRSIIAGMARMVMAFVDHFQPRGRESPCQSVANIRFKCHYFELPPSILRILP